MEDAPVKPPAVRGAVTIQEVARRAGVSTATVSRALAMPDRVTDATREAVFAAIRETGYTPNAAARNLRARTTKMVLVLLPGIGNSFFTPILNALEEVFSEAGYGVLIGYTRQDRSRETHYARVIRAGQVDGVLLVTGHLPRDEEFTHFPYTVPVSLLLSEMPGYGGLSVFDVENRAAARTMTEHLIGLGHRRIAHIAGPTLNPEANERMAGYREALAAAGIPFDPGLLWTGATNFDFASGEAAARRFLDSTERPTAVFAAADEIAFGFLRAIRSAGVVAPRDVSVAGFDDTEYAFHYDPALTTMHQPRTEIGRRAAEDMLRRMRGGAEPEPTVRVRLPCALVVRESARRLD